MSDIIAAVSTGSQICAIGIIRLSGPGCIPVAGRVFRPQNGQPLTGAPNRKLILGTLLDAKGRALDHCMAVCTRGPHSYTGEDTVEFHCHGSPAVLGAGLDALFAAGARLARRGEFTKRAFLHGKMDLTQSEAVIDLIEAETADAAANAAGQLAGSLTAKLEPVYSQLTDICSHFHAVLDYPDEDIDDFSLAQYAGQLQALQDILEGLLETARRGRFLRQGVRAVILGKPNVGKSSLLNALAGFDRVIVTAQAGTTRDTVEETVMVGGVRLRLTDTAGIRQTQDEIESLGVARSRQAARQAQLAIFVCDGSRPLDEEDRQAIAAAQTAETAIALINKSDLPQRLTEPLPFRQVFPISAREKTGFAPLEQAIAAQFGAQAQCDGSILTNPRQIQAISRAAGHIRQARQALDMTPDAVLTDVEAAMEALGECTGRTVREDITNRIFERFCVGK